MTAPPPLPTPGDYAGYAQWKDWGESAFMAPSAVERSYYSRELRGLDLRGRDVLELGFGNGAFLAFAREAGARLYGTELQPDLAARAAGAAVTLVDPDLTRLLPADIGKFTLIAAFDVFEHIDRAELPVLLATIADLLADGGLLVARYPNGQSPFGRMHQHGDITHRTILSADIMRQLLQGLPFDPVHLGNPAHAAGAVEALRTITHRTLEIFLQRLYGNQTPLAPNSVAILRRQPRVPL